MPQILVIDDDIELCELLVEFLRPEGFDVEVVHEPQVGLQRALLNQHDLLILDVMLPGMNGFELLSHLRMGSQIPVLMLTARGEDLDRIRGLEMGADDYLPKPFNPRELVARIEAIGRRSGQSQRMDYPRCLKVDDLEVDFGARIILQRKKPVKVTAVEFSLLAELLRHAGRVMTRDELMLKVLRRGLETYDRSIDVHVSSLRRKLGHQINGRERIKSIRGVGYTYTEQREE